MRRVLMIVALVCVQALVSCATAVWDQPAIEQHEQLDIPDRFSLEGYIESLTGMNRKDLRGQQRRLEGELRSDASRKSHLKLAMVLMTGDELRKDYERIESLLNTVIQSEAAEAGVKASAEWLAAVNHNAKQSHERLSYEIEKNQDLQKKLQALSSLEQKLEKRSRQELR